MHRATVRCGCGTPGCSGIVTLSAAAQRHSEGSCDTCGEVWTLTSGALVSKYGILVSEARCGAAGDLAAG
jgi:hypothetical protein